ncbi:NAD-dependent epimerase/dehydratase family protein [Acetatifactor muris]|uniref:dTDP-glucose 4,6-dehydratase 2 n=1 Tax=Acetatifactor muris TaxID=879566 RepID=A0A2K4ZG74_9FIRM|nr:NAD-dependent epimerase/dehydratase family protein [Acetatifactor muris]MCR2045729.1 NAD-dependent epimerase/dehydratase family protein [Acetatifactor muris]SOY29467.1 dTDP-glucose 4,6-dehydratase 2 [Acetatifactor muris]
MDKVDIKLGGKVILITGVAGFIGATLARKLFDIYNDIRIVGIDNMNSYYDVSLKEYRLGWLLKEASFIFIKGDITDKELVLSVFKQYRPQIVINLAAQAGVRYSINNPDTYIESNIIGFYNVLEACRNYSVEHLVFASSSSVYGLNKKIPYSTEDKTDFPVSLYAATKKSNELFAHAYAKLYNIPITGVRFFTVYGPAGRPDMAYFGFVDKLRRGEEIQIFNYGKCKRDFTYIDDVVRGLTYILCKAPLRMNKENENLQPPYAVYNIGNGQPENLLDFVGILQQELIEVGILPRDYEFEKYKRLVPMQQGDVAVTYADTRTLKTDFDFIPTTSLREGLKRFVEWYKTYYCI